MRYPIYMGLCQNCEIFLDSGTRNTYASFNKGSQVPCTMSGESNCFLLLCTVGGGPICCGSQWGGSSGLSPLCLPEVLPRGGAYGRESEDAFLSRRGICSLKPWCERWHVRCANSSSRVSALLFPMSFSVPCPNGDLPCPEVSDSGKHHESFVLVQIGRLTDGHN